MSTPLGSSPSETVPAASPGATMKVLENAGREAWPAASTATTTILYSPPGVRESPLTTPPLSPPKLWAARTRVPLALSTTPTTNCTLLDSASDPAQRPSTSVGSATVINVFASSAYVLGKTLAYCTVGGVRSTRTPLVLYSAVRPAPLVKVREVR